MNNSVTSLFDHENLEGFSSERLLYRAITLDDAPLMAAFMAEYDQAKMTGSIPHPFSVDQAKERILRKRKAEYPSLNWAITLKDGTYIGDISFFKRPELVDAPEWEIGYSIGSDYAGHGYATEALRRLIIWGRENLKADILACCFYDNPASRHILLKCGFVETGMSTGWSIAREMVTGETKTNGYDFTLRINS